MKKTEGGFDAALRQATFSLKFVLRGASKRPLAREELQSTAPFATDHLVVILPKDLATVPGFILDDLCYDDQRISELSIICPPDQKIDISPILNAAREHLAPDASIHLSRCFLTQKIFAQLCEEWADVNLIGCAFGKNWWKPPRLPRICRRLWIQGCTAVKPPSCRPGSASWTSLKRLTVHQGNFGAGLDAGGTPLSEILSRYKSTYPDATRELVTSLCGSSITTLSVYNCEDISFLSRFGDFDCLQELNLSGSPITCETFEWLVDQKGLTSSMLSWRPEVSLPWERLKKLRKLRTLDVVDSSFADADLIRVAQNTKLRALYAYNTHLSPLSWNLLFSIPTLRLAYISKEMLEGPQPLELPPTTKLKEVVALNVADRHMEYLTTLLSSYPHVKHFRM